MEQIKIGTCVPGEHVVEYLPHLIRAGFECISINFHMTLNGIDLKKLAEAIRPQLEEAGISVASLGYYCNPVQEAEHQKTLEHCIDSAAYFGTGIVSTFAGAYEGESVEKAMPKFGEVFRELSKCAEEKNVKIAIENCPMGGNWQSATCNIGFHPKAWEMMFHEVPAENVGLEWEPGHQMIQLIDPIAQLREWAPTGRILHMHGKDCSIDHTAVAKYGVFGAVDFAPQRTPGFGDTNWRDIFSILHAVGYAGDIAVEGYHDPIYKDEWEYTAQVHALNYLKWCRGGDFIPSPWKG